MWEILRDLRDRGRTVLLTTHYMDEAERLCDRVAIVDHGKVIALGSPAELIARLGGDHVIELAFADGLPAPPLAAFAELPGVLSAREEDGVVGLRVSRLHEVLVLLVSGAWTATRVRRGRAPGCRG
jgi:ABC-2 type transport system ATP-binding protein